MSALRDIHNATDILRAIVRRRHRNRGSLTRLSNDTDIDIGDLIAFAEGSPLSGEDLQRLNDRVLHGVARFDPLNDSFVANKRGPRQQRWF